MYLACIKKELLHHVLSARYVTILVLLLAVTLGVTVVRSHVYVRLAEGYRLAQVERNEILQKAGSYWAASRQASWVDKPPEKLWIFAGGLDGEMTRSYCLEHLTMTGLGMRKLPNASLRYFLDLDMVQVIAFLGSLLALIMIFDAVSGEREMNTLKVLLAGPTPRDTVIVGKIVAGAIVVCTPLVLAWLLTLLYTLGPAGVRLDPQQFARLGLAALMSVVYILFFFSLGMAVSCWFRRSATVLVICLLSWTGFALVIPNVIPVVANLIVPLPTHAKMVREKNSIWTTIEKELLPRYQTKISAEGVIDGAFGDSTVMFWQTKSREWFERINQSCSNIIQQQTLLAGRLSLLSPTAAYVHATTNLAGTGAQDFVHFLAEHDRAVRDYSTFQKTLYLDATAPAHYDAALLPAFKPAPVSLPVSVLQVLPDLLMLSAGCVILLLIAFVGFVRLDVVG